MAAGPNNAGMKARRDTLTLLAPVPAPVLVLMATRRGGWKRGAARPLTEWQQLNSATTATTVTSHVAPRTVVVVAAMAGRWRHEDDVAECNGSMSPTDEIQRKFELPVTSPGENRDSEGARGVYAHATARGAVMQPRKLYTHHGPCP